MRKQMVALMAVAVVVAACEVLAQEANVTRLPEGSGLAACYPGDVGIEKDRAVVFAEDFEDGTLDALLRR